MKHRNFLPRFAGAAAATSLLMGLALFGASSAYARPDDGWRSGPDMAFDPQVERMTDQLDLTKDQQDKIRNIMDEARKAREQQRLEVRKQIESVLTDEQKTKRGSMLKDHMERRLERMTDRLDLSDEQVAKMKALFEEQAKNPELTRSDVREQLSEILTEEQRAELRDKRRPHHGHDRRDRGERGDRPDCG